MLTDAELVHYYVTYKQVNFNSTRKMLPRSQTSLSLSLAMKVVGTQGRKGRGEEERPLSFLLSVIPRVLVPSFCASSSPACDYMYNQSA